MTRPRSLLNLRWWDCDMQGYEVTTGAECTKNTGYQPRGTEA